MNSDLNIFLQAWTGGGDVSAEECQRLLIQLRDDADFRAECVTEIQMLGMCKTAQSSTPRWPELCDILGLEEEQNVGTSDFALEVMEKVSSDIGSRRSRAFSLRSRWVPLAAAAAGLMIGVFSASFVWAIAKPAASVPVRKVLMEGFESAALKFEKRFPDRAGIWNGQNAALVESNSAAEGQFVLRFDPRELRKISHLNYLLDVTSLGDSQWNESRELQIAAKVRSVGSVATDHRYTVRLVAFSEDPDEVKEQWFSGSYGIDSALTFGSRSVKSKGGDWVSLEATIPLPPEARYVVISIGAASLNEQLKLNAVHEVDSLKLELITSSNL